MKLTRQEELNLRAKQIRTRRLSLQKEIAEAVATQQHWYDTELKPSAAAAGVYQTATRASRLDTTSPVAMEVAELLDGSTATSRFERARAHIEHYSGIVARKRKQEAKLAAELDRIREELGRIMRAAGGSVPDSLRAPWGALPVDRRDATLPGLPPGAGERVDALRALAQDARRGIRMRQGAA